VWSIYEDRLETHDTADLGNYQLVKEFLATTWPGKSPESDGDIKPFGIYRAAIDCRYRADTVYDFCRTAPVPLVPVRGDDTVKTRTWRVVKAAGGTLNRYDLNVNAFKDRLHRLMYAPTPGPGYYHLHRDTEPDTLEQLTSEEQRKIRRGRKVETVWQLKRSHRANHLWDCNVYATFAAELAGVRLLRDPDTPVNENKRKVGVRKNYQR